MIRAMAAVDSLVGRTIGKYTLQRELGRGGMGEVYLATHIVLGTRVAIKVLAGKLTGDARASERMLREALAAGRVEHEGVPRVLDVGTTEPEGRPYLVMDFLDGEALATHLRQADRLPLDQALAIAVEILAVLEVAHAAGVIHRDLKPHNVLLTRTGRVVVLDFGVAKLLDPDAARLTMTGAMIGTPAYMAPEQIKSGAVDARSDLYAVGCILYEMAVGRRPFDGDSTFEILDGHMKRRPPPPRALRPEVPTELQEVILTALAKEPTRRFRSATAMRQALLAVPGAATARVVAPASAAAPAPPAGADDGADSTRVLPEPGTAATAAARGGPPAPDTVPSRPLPRAAQGAASGPVAAVEAAHPPAPRPAPRPAPVSPPARAPAPAPVEPGGRGRRWSWRAPLLVLAVTGAAAGALALGLGRGDDAGHPLAAPPRPVDAALAVDPAQAVVALAPVDAAGPHAPPPTVDAGAPSVARAQPADAGSKPTTRPGGAVPAGAGTEVFVFTSTPGATVLVDGKRRGTTPWNQRLRPGTVTVTVRMAGYQTITRRLTVGAEPVSLDLQLEPSIPF